ncbi:hypothetical protein Hanom_Chr08g00722781 [Helianthus anomalus]
MKCDTYNTLKHSQIVIKCKGFVKLYTRTQCDVHAAMLEVFLNQFDECVKRINGPFTEPFQLYPESEKIKEKHTMWTEILKKVGSTCTTTGKTQTPTDKTPEKEENKNNVDLSQ